jgi:mono/diheme cytochrome c family protein
MHKAVSFSLVVALAAITAACPGDDRQQATPATDQTTTAPGTTPGTTGDAAAPAMGDAAANLPPGVTAQMVGEGQQLYGTVCIACHGAGGTGGPLGPALNDQNWIHITGEFEEIVTITRNGVAQPREYPAPMPPMGGGNFNDDQLRAISAYVYSISHGG